MSPRSASVATVIAGIILSLSAAASASGDAAHQHVPDPTIGPDQLDQLRPRLQHMAESLIPAIEDDVAAIRAQLKAQGLPRSEYAVVFGHGVVRSGRCIPGAEMSQE